MPTTEAFSRALIDTLLKDQGWNLTDGHSVYCEYTLSDAKRADYLLCGRHGCWLAITEAKRSSINAADAARHYAELAQVPYFFLANGEEIRIAGHNYQKDCIDRLCRESSLGRRRLLVEMAAVTAKAQAVFDAPQARVFDGS